MDAFDVLRIGSALSESTGNLPKITTYDLSTDYPEAITTIKQHSVTMISYLFTSGTAYNVIQLISPGASVTIMGAAIDSSTSSYSITGSITLQSSTRVKVTHSYGMLPSSLVLRSGLIGVD